MSLDARYYNDGAAGRFQPLSEEGGAAAWSGAAASEIADFYCPIQGTENTEREGQKIMVTSVEHQMEIWGELNSSQYIRYMWVKLKVPRADAPAPQEFLESITDGVTAGSVTLWNAQKLNGGMFDHFTAPPQGQDRDWRQKIKILKEGVIRIHPERSIATVALRLKWRQGFRPVQEYPSGAGALAPLKGEIQLWMWCRDSSVDDGGAGIVRPLLKWYKSKCYFYDA